MIGGQVGIRTLNNRDNVRIQAAGVGRNIKDNEVLQEVLHLIQIIVNHTFILRTFQNLLLK
jgi:hypothetical protein